MTKSRARDLLGIEDDVLMDADLHAHYRRAMQKARDRSAGEATMAEINAAYELLLTR
ncbi:hypothetical protein [Acuticoccus yangtzensis]|uniref:hypothetical protein n=1 Tax=Acuticoccus yangtzensis TaxID=1443441 RepID=UPI001300786F|nr:hypothetical protein [Acuticoccus yangtzensis]